MYIYIHIDIHIDNIHIYIYIYILSCLSSHIEMENEDSYFSNNFSSYTSLFSASISLSFEQRYCTNLYHAYLISFIRVSSEFVRCSLPLSSSLVLSLPLSHQHLPSHIFSISSDPSSSLDRMQERLSRWFARYSSACRLDENVAVEIDALGI